MNTIIEEILINSILEQTENDSQLSIKSVQLAFSLLMDKKDLFDNVPRGICTPMSTYENYRKNSNISKDDIINELKSREDDIEYFSSKGILLYDGIHAAGGRMNYIYRSKGTRIYFFDDGNIKVFYTYCSIDHNGFNFSNDEIDSICISSLNSTESIENVFQYLPSFNRDTFFNYSISVIQLLIGIKKSFYKDYIIEFLLTPPDVDFISEFSLEFKNSLWDIFTDNAFIKEISAQTQKLIMSTLTGLGITPTTEQLLSYLELQERGNINQEILDKLKILQEAVIENKKEDIFDFKPNFYGIGFNGNEALRRLLSKSKK